MKTLTELQAEYQELRRKIIENGELQKQMLIEELGVKVGDRVQIMDKGQKSCEAVVLAILFKHALFDNNLQTSYRRETVTVRTRIIRPDGSLGSIADFLSSQVKPLNDLEQ